MFANMKVRVQLGLGFAVALLLMVAIAASGILGMKSSNDQLDDIVNDNMRKIELINTMSESVHIVSRVIRSMVLLDDAAAIKEEEQKLIAARAAYDKAWSELEKMPASERGQAIRASIRESSALARPINNKIVELALSNQDDEARTLLLKEGGPAVKKWQDALDENTALQKEITDKQAAEAAADYSRASTIMIVLSVAGIVLSLFIAFTITRNLMSQLGGEPAQTAEIANKIAAGDLSAKIELKSGDTTSLSYSMSVMQASLTQIVGEIRSIVAAANKGDFSTRMNLNGKAGYTKELSELLNQLSDTVDTAFKDTIHVAQALENGDLTQVVTREYQGAFDQVKQSLNNTVGKLSQVIGEVNGAATNIASASEEVSSTAQS
ncbi:MAG TPA: MCP four helix bundle domain-containing protein, partial [Gallionella sp.]|nr:MCP four helix bundle domain-containing protein [Gallionella sp.]